ncbi:hypothetical protein PLESTB_001761000 [Pleodorina starrii]|uniref:RING-type domain-containing protein n=1 Tax=Pleodorina starrii TaxID=330485 RepID=A0A9W6C124_9CHLO|nr:hypothetical protein PLESTM_000602600 [Pleodorina starrii]GLC61480.1 hypothetical protein PLESTB_001761000 [Pleodorina starrii]GLC74120.1 hypothetical protein PLESTF_001462100 [Pleodorina starrii]
MDRAAKLQEIRERQNRWLRERQAELDRRHVVAELQQQQHSSSPQPQQRRTTGAAPPSAATANGGGASSSSGLTLPPLTASSGSSFSTSAAGNVGGGGGVMGGSMAGVLPSTLGGVGGVKPEEVIDRLTERITDRLRNELKVELQRESESLAAQQGALDTFLVKELESQNTCPICYELMVPPQHAPVMLFPCGHSFCGRCLDQHIDRNKKTQCPVCRKKIESRAPNYSLQQLIQQVVAKKEASGRGGPLGSPSSPGRRGLMEGGPGGAGAAEGLDGLEPGSNADRVRRQYERAATRMRVLRNELADTAVEEEALGGKVAAAAAVVGHLQEEEAVVLRRLAAVQAELDLVREQLGVQGSKVTDLARQAEAVRQRRELLQATLGPLEQEVEKLEVLMAGVMEMGQ